MNRAATCLLSVTALSACSSNSNAPVGDARAAGDRPAAELRVSPDGARERSITPDGPKPSPVWKAVSGTGPAVAGLTATLLNDGKVLVVGGYDYPSPNVSVPRYQKAAWLYDPAANAFSPAGALQTARDSHSASLLPDGRVLIAGGFDGDIELDSTEIFDPTKPAASAWSAGPSLIGKRFDHSAVTLSDKRIVMAGGAAYPSMLGSLLIFNPTTMTFQAPAMGLNKPRSSMGSALLGNGKILLAGGDDGSSAFSNVIETFDPSTGSVAMLGITLATPKAGQRAFTLPSGKVFITAGYSFSHPPTDDLFDPAAGTIAPITHPGGETRGSRATMLADGRVLVAGGFYSEQESKVRVFSDKAMMWDMLPDLLHSRSYFELVTLKDGSVLAVGGMASDHSSFVGEAERLYNP